MSRCPTLSGDGPSGIAEALRVVDCNSGEAASYAFARLFGSDAVLGQALTVALTLYIAFYAVGLLTGRVSLGLSSVTPRMMTLGIALTFATSWIAYQSVVWNLLAGAPDQIASLLMGVRGSATTLFADRLDTVFGVVAQAAAAAEARAVPGTPDTLASGSDLLWLAAMLFLLGTVGVLVTAKIGLAAMLALGPIFIIFALFQGTRGLFEGWLKVGVLFALTPLFAVLIGGGAIAMIAPMVESLAMTGGEVPLRTAATLFLAAAVYCALMVVALKIAGTTVAGWRLPFGRDLPSQAAIMPAQPQSAAIPPLAEGQGHRPGTNGDPRVRAIVSAATSSPPLPSSAAAVAYLSHRNADFAGPGIVQPAVPASPDRRASSISRQFRPRLISPEKIAS